VILQLSLRGPTEILPEFEKCNQTQLNNFHSVIYFACIYQYVVRYLNVIIARLMAIANLFLKFVAELPCIAAIPELSSHTKTQRGCSLYCDVVCSAEQAVT